MGAIEVTQDTVQEVIQEQADADIESGFNAARGIETAPSAEPVTPDEQPAEEVVVAEEEKPLIAGFTNEQVRELLNKAAQVDKLNQRIDMSFSKFGEVNRTAMELKEKLAQQPTQGRLALSGVKLQQMREEFPEFATFFDDVEPVAQAPAAIFDPAPLEESFNAKLIEVEQKLEKKALKLQHRDWESVVAKAEFADWKANHLSPDLAAELDNSWDAEFIGDRLTEFKEWQSAQDAAKQKQQQKDKRLEAAIAPTGGSAPTPASSPNDDFEKAFKRVNQGRLGYG